MTDSTATTLAPGVAGRYASALFDLAAAARSIDTVGASLSSLRQAITDSGELKRLLVSPLTTRAAAARAVDALAGLFGLDDLTRKFLGVLALNRRLSTLPDVIAGYFALSAAHRGEITARVRSAHPLSAEQVETLKARLKARLKRDIDAQVTVDPTLLGGLIVKVGSRQIDSSLKTKLDTLSLALKAKI